MGWGKAMLDSEYMFLRVDPGRAYGGECFWCTLHRDIACGRFGVGSWGYLSVSLVLLRLH